MQRHGLGISFMCPLHRQPSDRLAVWFANPVDGGEPHVDHTHVDPATHMIVHDHPKHLWQRVHHTFEDLTLSPSVDASKYGHWHGFIAEGNVT